MSEHFRAFSFVDRISSISASGGIEGVYAIPSGIAGFPSTLVAEAVGQLAAWGAMKVTGFQRRPIAGLAGRIDLLSSVRPGQTLRLAAHIQSLDEEAISYQGTATVDGAVVLRLEDCVGPMIETAELDDPKELRGRFELLAATGAAPEMFPGLPPLALTHAGQESEVSAAASFQVPDSASFFADHFPRRPVFPGSLLMQMCLELASTLAARIPPPASGGWTPQSVLNMKLREFLPPGRPLDLEAVLKQRSSASAMLLLTAKAGGEMVGSAKLLLGPGDGL
jgi:3-hydroxymyristoyl/3-hydroxydecanoyl-(acyl carrier protein) dehydratase